MGKIKNYLKNYFEKSSKLKIFSDVVFYLLIISLLIPSTRTMLIRATLFRPKMEANDAAMVMKPQEYQLMLEDLKGNQVNLADYSGKTVFISFWATWCPPCRAEMPSIQKLYNAYGDKLNVFLITTEERDKVQNYLDESGYNLPVYFQKSAASGVLNIQSYPTSYLISAEGEILIQKKGAADWNSRSFRKKLDELLNHIDD
jgi:thiol-disulfide isomerase/thioredoxin